MQPCVEERHQLKLEVDLASTVQCVAHTHTHLTHSTGAQALVGGLDCSRRCRSARQRRNRIMSTFFEYSFGRHCAFGSLVLLNLCIAPASCLYNKTLHLVPTAGAADDADSGGLQQVCATSSSELLEAPSLTNLALTCFSCSLHLPGQLSFFMPSFRAFVRPSTAWRFFGLFLTASTRCARLGQMTETSAAKRG